MRENPWHLRMPTTENYQWFKNLFTLHDLTIQWMTHFDLDHPAKIIPRGLKKELLEDLWMLDVLADPQAQLETLLDDTFPNDVLARLDRLVWISQGWTLSALQDQFSSSPDSFDLQIEEISQTHGTKCGEERWRYLIHRDQLCKDLRGILLSLNDSPLSGYPYNDGFLVRRALPKETQIELKACPHQTSYLEIKPLSDRLCKIHSQWMKGFIYALNPKIALEHVMQSPRCVQKWIFNPS